MQDGISTITLYVYELVSLTRFGTREKLQEAPAVKRSFTFEGTLKDLEGCFKRSKRESR